MAIGVHELIHAQFRSDGTVSVSLGQQRRRFLTTYDGFREGLESVQTRHIGNSRFTLDLLPRGMMKLENGRMRVAQVFPACDADITHHGKWVVGTGHPRPEDFIAALERHGVLVSAQPIERVAPVMTSGQAYKLTKVLIRARIPMRMWIADLKHDGMVDGERTTYLSTLIEEPKSLAVLPSLMRRWEASNVYAESNVCWGAYQTEVGRAKGIEGLDHLFLTTPFNDDLQFQWHWKIITSWLEVDPALYPGNVNNPVIPRVENGRVLIPAGSQQPHFEW